MSRSDFWSRRKADVEAEGAAEARALEAESLARVEAEKTDEELLTELGLPDPDTLSAGDDFSAFMAKAVPQRLRTRALRKLWLSNPTLANLDELVDYGQDFTDSAMAVESIQTTYQVGKGMLTHVQKMAEQAAREIEDEAPEAGDADAVAEPEVIAVAEEVDAPPPATGPEDHEANEDTLAAPPRRRMRFEFDADATA